MVYVSCKVRQDHNRGTVSADTITAEQEKDMLDLCVRHQSESAQQACKVIGPQVHFHFYGSNCSWGSSSNGHTSL